MTSSHFHTHRVFTQHTSVLTARRFGRLFFAPPTHSSRFFLCVCPRGLATPGCVLCARPPESHSVVSNTHFTAPPLPFLLRSRLDPKVKPGSPLPFSRSFARFAPGLTFVSNRASPAPLVVSAQFVPTWDKTELRLVSVQPPAVGRVAPPRPSRQRSYPMHMHWGVKTLTLQTTVCFLHL